MTCLLSLQMPTYKRVQFKKKSFGLCTRYSLTLFKSSYLRVDSVSSSADFCHQGIEGGIGTSRNNWFLLSILLCIIPSIKMDYIFYIKPQY